MILTPLRTGPTAARARYSDPDDQARGGRKDLATNQSLLPLNSALTQPPGN